MFTYVRRFLSALLVFLFLVGCGTVHTPTILPTTNPTAVPAPTGVPPRLDGKIAGLQLELVKEWGPLSSVDVVNELDLAAAPLYIGILSYDGQYTLSEYFQGLITNPVNTAGGQLQVYKLTSGNYLDGGREKIDSFLKSHGWQPISHGSAPVLEPTPSPLVEPALLGTYKFPARQPGDPVQPIKFEQNTTYSFVLIDEAAHFYIGLQSFKGVEAFYFFETPYPEVQGAEGLKLQVYQLPDSLDGENMVARKLERDGYRIAAWGSIHCPEMGGVKPNGCK